MGDSKGLSLFSFEPEFLRPPPSCFFADSALSFCVRVNVCYISV